MSSGCSGEHQGQFLQASKSMINIDFGQQMALAHFHGGRVTTDKRTQNAD